MLSFSNFNIGVQTPTVAGILVEGYTMTTYSMKLISEGVYTMVEHNKTYLLRRPDDICAAPRITESLMQLANLMRSTLKDIAAQSQLTQDILPAHQDWKRPSAGIPVRTEKKDQSPSLSSAIYRRR